MRTSEPVHELFLNYACTAKCPFCYNPPITPELLRLDLSFEQAAASLYKGAKSGAKHLNLHGGEVTLRDDLPKILALARKLGFAQVTVVTNGVRLGDKGYTESLLASGATHFRLSLHAETAAPHDAIVAIPGAFEKALAGLRGLLRLKVPVGLNFVLIRENHARLPAFLQKFCLEEGVEDVIVYFPHRRGLMALNEKRAGLSYEDAAPSVRAGAALLAKAGKKSSLLLANFTPCVLPELADLMLDWSHGEGAEGSMIHPEGTTEDLGGMKDSQRQLVVACRTCALKTRCRGVEKEYLAACGEGAFKPMAEAAV